jgi:putative glutamine amidotransferase
MTTASVHPSDHDARPLILVSVAMGDTWGHYWSRVFTRPLVAAGALPLLVSQLEREEDRRAALRRADGLLLAGGMDIDPARYGEEPDERLWELDPLRDAVELPLVREAVEEGVPVVGTCRGMQVINVAFGGTLYVDASDHPGAEAHPSGGLEGFQRMVEAELADRPVPDDIPRHPVRFAPGSWLAGAYGERAVVNSFHHQHVRELGTGLRATAHADDGVVEGIEGDPDRPLLLGVQWELQESWDRNPGQFAVFELLVAAARARRDRSTAPARGR